MRKLSRRSVTTAAIVGLSGCVGVLGTDTPTPTSPPPDQDGDGVPDAQDDYPDDYLRSKQVMVIEDQIKLNPDDYQAHRIRTKDGTFVIEWDIIVKSDYGIDVYFLDRHNYVEYTNGNEISYYSELSQKNIGSGILESAIEGGEYAVVLDYTNYGTDFGPTPVEVDYKIEVAAMP